MQQQRTLRIRGGHNFRDLGGYSTRDGRAVKWGQVYRSGVMAKIDPEDVEGLHRLGIVSICDFRTNSERSRRPTTWHAGGAIELVTHDYEMSVGVLQEIAKSNLFDSTKVRKLILDVYTDLPEEQAPNYTALFRQLASGKVPLVFNCSAGKDRTGVAAALILLALGVEKEEVIADYMLTNEWIESLVGILQQEPEYGRWVAEQPEVAYPLLRAEAEYLDTTLALLDDRYGGVEGYLTGRLGISAGEIETIRDLLLE